MEENAVLLLICGKEAAVQQAAEAILETDAFAYHGMAMPDGRPESTAVTLMLSVKAPQ